MRRFVLIAIAAAWPHAVWAQQPPQEETAQGADRAPLTATPARPPFEAAMKSSRTLHHNADKIAPAAGKSTRARKPPRPPVSTFK